MILNYCLDALKSSKVLQCCQKSTSDCAYGQINAGEEGQVALCSASQLHDVDLSLLSLPLNF